MIWIKRIRLRIAAYCRSLHKEESPSIPDDGLRRPASVGAGSEVAVNVRWAEDWLRGFSDMVEL